MQNKKAAFVSPFILAGLPKDSPVLVAFSGGADSSALLHMRAADSKEHGYPLFAAHLNHKIRGADALRDLEFCRTRAAEYKIPFEYHVYKKAGHGISTAIKMVNTPNDHVAKWVSEAIHFLQEIGVSL